MQNRRLDDIHASRFANTKGATQCMRSVLIMESSRETCETTVSYLMKSTRVFHSSKLRLAGHIRFNPFKLMSHLSWLASAGATSELSRFLLIWGWSGLGSGVLISCLSFSSSSLPLRFLSLLDQSFAYIFILISFADSHARCREHRSLTFPPRRICS
jgi:hypothetical protein